MAGIKFAHYRILGAPVDYYKYATMLILGREPPIHYAIVCSSLNSQFYYVQFHFHIGGYAGFVRGKEQIEASAGRGRYVE